MINNQEAPSTQPVVGPPARRLRDLLALVDRAERGSLLAEEATVLRQGLTALDAARRSAAGLQAALQAARARVRDLEAQVAEIAARRPAGGPR